MVRRMWLTIVIAVAIACRYASCCSSSCAFKALYVVQEWQYVMSYCFSRLFSVSQRHCVLSIWNSCWCWCWCLCLCLCYCCSYCFGHHQHYCFLSSPIAVAVIAAMPLDGLIDSVTLVKNLHGLARARASCTFIRFLFSQHICTHFLQAFCCAPSCFILYHFSSFAFHLFYFDFDFLSFELYRFFYRLRFLFLCQ